MQMTKQSKQFLNSSLKEEIELVALKKGIHINELSEIFDAYRFQTYFSNRINSLMNIEDSLNEDYFELMQGVNYIASTFENSYKEVKTINCLLANDESHPLLASCKGEKDVTAFLFVGEYLQLYRLNYISIEEHHIDELSEIVKLCREQERFIVLQDTEKVEIETESDAQQSVLSCINIYIMNEVDIPKVECKKLFISNLLETKLKNVECENLSIVNEKAEEYLEVSECGLSSFELKGFSNLKVLNISQNNLEIINLFCYNELLELNASHNKIRAFVLPESIEVADIAFNELTEIELNDHPNLQKLLLTSNKIAKFNITGCSELEWVYLNENPLQDVSALEEIAQLKIVNLDKTSVKQYNIIKNEGLYELECILTPISKIFASYDSEIVETLQFTHSSKENIKIATEFFANAKKRANDEFYKNQKQERVLLCTDEIIDIVYE